MRQRSNPLRLGQPVFTVLTQSGNLIVYWKSVIGHSENPKIGFTADGFSFFYDQSMINWVLQDRSAQIRYDHAFDLRHSHRLTIDHKGIEYFECQCGCGLVAAHSLVEGQGFQLFESLEDLRLQPVPVIA